MAELGAALDNLWFLLNFVEGLLFLASAVYFTAKPEKVRFMISNFAHLSKEKQARYDLKGLSRYVCRAFTLCGAVCVAGAVAALWLNAYAYWTSTLLWIVIAAVTLRVDNEKLLKKYRRDAEE